MIRNARTWKVRNIIPTGIPFEDVAFSPDGKDVLTAGTDSVATTLARPHRPACCCGWSATAAGS